MQQEQEKQEALWRDQKIPFVVDGYCHQYYLRESPRRTPCPDGVGPRERVYLLGNRYIHCINFKRRQWDTFCKANYEKYYQ